MRGCVISSFPPAPPADRPPPASVTFNTFGSSLGEARLHHLYITSYLQCYVTRCGSHKDGVACGRQALWDTTVTVAPLYGEGAAEQQVSKWPRPLAPP